MELCGRSEILTMAVEKSVKALQEEAISAHRVCVVSGEGQGGQGVLSGVFPERLAPEVGWKR